MIVKVIRELVKLCMFTVIWGIPMYLAKVNEHNGYLFLFLVSFVVMQAMFDHFETLEQKENEQ